MPLFDTSESEQTKGPLKRCGATKYIGVSNAWATGGYVHLRVCACARVHVYMCMSCSRARWSRQSTRHNRSNNTSRVLHALPTLVSSSSISRDKRGTQATVVGEKWKAYWPATVLERRRAGSQSSRDILCLHGSNKGCELDSRTVVSRRVQVTPV